MDIIKAFFDKHGIISGLILILTLLGLLYKIICHFTNSVKLKIKATKDNYILDPYTKNFISFCEQLDLDDYFKSGGKVESFEDYKSNKSDINHYNTFISLKITNKSNKKIENLELHLLKDKFLFNSSLLTIKYPNNKTITKKFDNLVKLDDLNIENTISINIWTDEFCSLETPFLTYSNGKKIISYSFKSYFNYCFDKHLILFCLFSGLLTYVLLLFFSK